MRVAFSEVFRDNRDGSYTPFHKVKIGGLTVEPGEVRFTPGVLFSGVDIAHYVGHDLEVDQDAGGTVEIISIY